MPLQTTVLVIADGQGCPHFLICNLHSVCNVYKWSALDLQISNDEPIRVYDARAMLIQLTCCSHKHLAARSPDLPVAGLGAAC